MIFQRLKQCEIGSYLDAEVPLRAQEVVYNIAIKSRWSVPHIFVDPKRTEVNTKIVNNFFYIPLSDFFFLTLYLAFSKCQGL